MGQIKSYTAPNRALNDTDVVLGDATGTNAIPMADLSAYIRDKLGSMDLSGLPREEDGDAPEAGSGQLYTSGGVLKVA